MNPASSIRRRLVIALSATFIALYALTALFVHHRMSRNLMDGLDRHVSSKLADFIAETTIERDGFHAYFHDLKLPEFGPKSKSAYYEMFDPGGASVLRSRSLPADWHLPQVIPIHKKGSDVAPMVLPDGRNARVKTGPINGPGDMSNYMLTLAEDATPAEEEIAEIAAALLAGGLIMGIGCLAAVILVVRWMSGPILQLADHAAAFDLRQLKDRLPAANVPQELLPLVTRFNALLDRLSDAVAHERRFAAAMAHELRTPIAELQVLADVALTEVKAPAPMEPAEVYRLAADLSRRMTRLVEVLSSLHRAESGRQLLWIQPLDLNALIAHRIERLRPLADARRMTVAFQPAGNGLHETDGALFTAVVDNLLSNAVEHSPEGSTVMVRWEGSCLEVSNPAPELTAADLANFEEPFWQKDAARSKSNSFGLGLALTRAYADLLKAKITFSLHGGILRAAWSEPNTNLSI